MASDKTTLYNVIKMSVFFNFGKDRKPWGRHPMERRSPMTFYEFGIFREGNGGN